MNPGEGLRVGEAIRLGCADIDTVDALLSVRRSKFNSSRQLPLHPSTVAALVTYSRCGTSFARTDGQTPSSSPPGEPP